MKDIVMALPVITTTFYSTTLPSTKEVIRFRSYQVREEKILLTAAESNSTNEIMNAILQIITNCLEDRKFNINKLTSADITWLWVQLSAKTVNNSYDIKYKHGDEQIKVTIDLNEVFVEYPENVVAAEYLIEGKHGIKFKRINFKDTITMDFENIDITSIMKRSIEHIYDETDVYDLDNETEEEINRYIDQLSYNTINHFKNFLENEPKIVYRRTVKHNGKDVEIELEGLADFFQLG